MRRFPKLVSLALLPLAGLLIAPAIGLASGTPALAAGTAPAAPAAAAPAAAAPAAAAPAPAQAGNTQPHVVHASKDDFTFASFDADYYLGRDDEQHSTLRTVERLVAVFPQIDQNRGIRRAIPNHYRGHPVDLTITSVTDENGNPRDFETEEDEDDGDITLLTIAADDYVHGEQTYVIEYTQRYVTFVPDDATADNGNEFFWDVNGTGWAQPFGQVTATIHVADDIADHYTGAAACYRGEYGSSDPCDGLETGITDAQSGANALIVRAHADNLGPYENLSVALGFRADTFVPRDDAYLASGTGYGQLIGLAGLAAALLLGLVYRATRWRDHPGRGIIIPEYLPPKGVSVLTASDLHGKANNATAAALLDMAVRHNVRVIEQPPKSRIGGKPRYVLELVNAQGLDKDMRALAVALFGSNLTPGARRDLSKPDSKLGTKIMKVRTDAKKQVVTVGYRRKLRGQRRALVTWLGVSFFAVATVFGVWTTADELGGGLPVLLLVIGAAGFVGVLMTVSNVRPITEQGAVLRDWLRGMEMYIKLAEADRLRVLQSPTGALRTEYSPAESSPVATLTEPTTGEIVKLYEKLLPYAVLFGLEKEWAKQLGEYYARDNSQPDWYEGQGAFNAGLFAAGIGSLSSTASSSWSGSSSSSSSGGSSGGGFSGGGGGGGGGGGV